MQRILRALCHSFLGLVILMPASAARAQEVQVEFVYPPVRFLSAATGADDERIEPSGVEPIGDGSLLLIADDKRASLIVVEAATGRAKHSLLMGISDKRPKWEELAHDDEGGYYVIGSRFFEEPSEDGADKKTIAAPRLLRFRLQSDGERETSPVVDPESIIEWDITEALVAAGYRRDVRKNEVNIEGLAVRTLRDPVGRLTLRGASSSACASRMILPVLTRPISRSCPPRTPSSRCILFSGSMPVYEQGSHHTCRPLTTWPRGGAFSCLPPPRTKTIVITATRYGFCPTIKSRRHSPLRYRAIQ